MTVGRIGTGLLAIVVAGAAFADDWPQWRGPGRDAISREQGLLADWTPPPRQIWLVKTPGAGYTPPSVAGGVIYLTGSAGAGKARVGTLYALDARTGAIAWQYEYGPEWGQNYELARCAPTVADGRVYVIGSMGRVVCVDARSGQRVWAVDTFERFKGKNTRWGMAESPLLVGKTVICHPGGPDAAVAALDAATGATVWTTKGLSDASAYCSPALLTVNGRKQIVTQTENDVLGIDPETGAVLWKFAHRNTYAVHANTPVVFGKDLVIVSSGYGYGTEGLRIGAEGAKRVWQVKEADCHFHGMVLLGERLYVTGSKGPLFCIDPATGAVRSRTEAVGRAAIIAAGGGLIAYSESAKAVQAIKLDGDTCRVAGSFPVDFGSHEHWSAPVVANGVLYIRHGEALAAYDLKAAK